MAALRSQSLQAMLSIGQVAVMAAGSMVVMVMSARGVSAGSMTVGDFVLVNSFLLQFYAPWACLARSMAM